MPIRSTMTFTRPNTETPWYQWSETIVNYLDNYVIYGTMGPLGSEISANGLEKIQSWFWEDRESYDAYTETPIYKDEMQRMELYNTERGITVKKEINDL